MQLRPQLLGPVVLPFALSALTVAACGSGRQAFEDPAADGGPGGGFTDEGGVLGGDAQAPGDGQDPVTCEQALAAKSYVGCDYWPTVSANIVQNVFDFAVAVANVGAEKANVTVTGPGGTNEVITVEPGSLGTVYLPWVPELKGGASGLPASTVAKKSAFHLVSDRPVVVYQFNPLEFRAAGGKPGKDWSTCQKPPVFPQPPECYSYSNDASLLLPSSAMTGAYRVMGPTGFSRGQPLMGTTLTVTATADGTKVELKLGAKAKVVAGGPIPATQPGGTVTLTLDAGDVAELVADAGSGFDFSGSLLIADKPVQVITGVPCIDVPQNVQACDHVEETVFPAETLGKRYVVMTPTGPKANQVGHVVRFYGNVDGTKLTYAPSKPAGCPDTLAAGEVVDCGEVTSDFEVTGDQSFGVGTFMLGGEKADPDFNPLSLAQPQGDPSQSFPVAVEQYRQRYVFLAPNDYKTSYVDVIASPGTKLTLDGADVSAQLQPLSGTAYERARVKLGSGKDGVHTLEGDKPVGIQVIGYGDNTSYQYPGGLNLGRITTVPPK